MFPLRDHNPSTRFPFITYSIIAICTLVWFYELSLWSGIEIFFEKWALQPWEITSGQNYITLLTSMFLHGWWMHLIGNMLFLYIFWDNLESRMGHFLFCFFYLACWLAASWLQILTDPSSMIPNLWASGAIAGVMWGYLYLFPKAQVDVLAIWVGWNVTQMPAYAMLGYWIVMQLIFGAFSFWQEWWGVAYWAHIWGFFAGLIMVLPFKRDTQPPIPPSPPKNKRWIPM